MGIVQGPLIFPVHLESKSRIANGVEQGPVPLRRPSNEPTLILISMAERAEGRFSMHILYV